MLPKTGATVPSDLLDQFTVSLVMRYFYMKNDILPIYLYKKQKNNQQVRIILLVGGGCANLFNFYLSYVPRTSDNHMLASNVQYRYTA